MLADMYWRRFSTSKVNVEIIIFQFWLKLPATHCKSTDLFRELFDLNERITYAYALRCALDGKKSKKENKKDWYLHLHTGNSITLWIAFFVIVFFSLRSIIEIRSLLSNTKQGEIH